MHQCVWEEGREGVSGCGRKGGREWVREEGNKAVCGGGTEGGKRVSVN